MAIDLTATIGEMPHVPVQAALRSMQGAQDAMRFEQESPDSA